MPHQSVYQTTKHSYCHLWTKTETLKFHNLGQQLTSNLLEPWWSNSQIFFCCLYLKGNKERKKERPVAKVPCWNRTRDEVASVEATQTKHSPIHHFLTPLFLHAQSTLQILEVAVLCRNPNYIICKRWDPIPRSPILTLSILRFHVKHKHDKNTAVIQVIGLDDTWVYCSKLSTTTRGISFLRCVLDMLWEYLL